MAKRGAKPILNQHSEPVFREMILEFDQEHNIRSLVGYSDIYKFVKSKYKAYGLSRYPGQTWWKTSSGKHLIDEYNRIKTKSVAISEREQIDIPDLMDVVTKYGGANVSVLKEHLRDFDLLVSRLLSRLQTLSSSIEQMQSEIEGLRLDNKTLNNTNIALQQLIFALFAYGNRSNNELVNMITTGKSRSKVVNLSLTETFGNPRNFIDELTKHVDVQCGNKFNNGVIQFPGTSTESATPPADDYDY